MVHGRRIKTISLSKGDHFEVSMKPDVLTITAIVFVVGVLISSFGATDGLSGDAKTGEIPPVLQQGIVLG